MQKSIVVAVEWQVRHGLYGKTERRTSKFMVHDENNDAKIGDIVDDRRDASAEPPQALGAEARRAAGGAGLARAGQAGQAGRAGRNSCQPVQPASPSSPGEQS